MARLSEINLGLYRTFLQPWVKAVVTPPAATVLRRLSPARLQYELVADENPLVAPLAGIADQVRQNRQPAGPDNPFLAWQEMWSQQVVAALDAYRDLRDAAGEAAFHAFYGSPLVQAMLGLRASDGPPRARPGREPEEIAFVREQTEALLARMAEGGLREAFIRALIYVRLPELAADERGFNMLQRLRDEYGSDLKLADFKEKLREQFMLLMLDPKRAVATLPQLLAGREADAPKALELLRSVLDAGGPMIAESERRLAEVATMFGASGKPAAPRRRLSVAGGTDAAG